MVVLLGLSPPIHSAAICPEPPTVPAQYAALRPTDVLLAVTSPRAGEAVSTSDGTLTVNVDYWGPRLVAPGPGRPVDTYHLTFFLDADPMPYVGTLLPMPTCDARVADSAEPRWSFSNVAAGSHSVTVMLAGANRVSVNPPVAMRVTFVVK